jgi:hypothetical protein
MMLAGKEFNEILSRGFLRVLCLYGSLQFADGRRKEKAF